MSKYIKPERKDKKEKDHKIKETKDRDIHLNVIGVPVTNVSVDKTLERQPASDFHMYRISIDTSSRSSRETKEKRSSTIRGPTSPRAVSNPPRPVRIPIIPSDSSSTASDVSHRLPRSVSTSAMKNAELQSGNANAAHNPRDKHHGSKKARPKPPPKKAKDPVVCYTEEKRPLRIVGRLKTPEDDKDRQRKLPSGRKNSKQVEFSDENSVYVAGDEEHPIGNALSNVPYKGTRPNVYPVQNKGNSQSIFGSKNIPHPDTNEEELPKPSTIPQSGKISEKPNIANDKRSELKPSISPELKNSDRQKSDNHSKDRVVNYRPLHKSDAPEYSLSSRPPDAAGPSREWPNQSNTKPGKSSIEEKKEPMPKKIIDVEPNTYADPTKNYPAYKPVGNSYSRKINSTPSGENAAKGYISPTYSNDSTGYPKERPNMKPVRSAIDEKKDTMPTKSNGVDTETEDHPTKNYPSYKHVGNSYSGKINFIPSEENAKRGYISPTHSKDSTGHPNDRSSYTIMKPIGSNIANNKETILNEDFIPKLNQYDGKTTPIKPEEHSYTRNINATPSIKNAAKVSPTDYNVSSRLPENKTNNMGVPSSSRNVTRRGISNKQTSNSQVLNDKTGYGPLKGEVDHSELPPVKSFVERIPMEEDIFSETPRKKVVPKHAAKDFRTIDVIGNAQLDGKNFNLKSQPPITEKYSQVSEKYDTNITPISNRSISPTSMRRNQDNSGIQPERHYPSSSNRVQYEPTAEKKSMTVTSMAPPKIQFKRMASTPLSNRSSKESTGPKGDPMDRSPSRMKYLTYPLVSSIPKPTITSSKYNSAVDDRDANKSHVPIQKPSEVQEGMLGVNTITSTDTVDRIRPTKGFPITVDYEDFYTQAQSPAYYTVQDGQPQADGRSVEISHRTYGELSPVNTLGKIPNNSPMDVSLEGNRAKEKPVNSNYIGMDPRDNRALYNKSQTNPDLEEPVFTASYIPTNHISKIMKDGSFSHKFNTQPADSLDEDKTRTSGTNFLNVSPKYSVAPSRRLVNQDEMNYPLEYMKASDVKDNDLNARTSKENSKHSVNEKLFENQMHNDYEGITPQEIYNGSRSPSSHDWTKSGTSKPEVYAYVGHIDPNNPFGHKPDHEEDLIVDHIDDILPDVSKYIENGTVPRGSVEAPGSEHRFDGHVISNQEHDQFYKSPLYKDDMKGIPKAESKRIRGSINEVPLGRVGRASKKSMPTIETIQEEDFETGVSDSFFKPNSAKPALDGEGEIYNHTIPDSSEVAGRQSRNASLVHANDLNEDSEIYGYGSNDKRGSPRDMFAYLGDVDNANPFGHKGGVDGMSDKENLKNISVDYPRDKISMMPLVGSQGVSSEPRDNSTTQEFRVLPNENESAETSTLFEKNKANHKPQKEPLPSAKAKRKSREPEKSRGTITSLESNRHSSEPEAVFLGKIPKTTMNVFYSPNSESKTLPVNAEARQLGDGPIQQTDNGSVITEGPKGILIFVNKKNDQDRSPFEDPDKLKNKRSTDYLSKNSKGDSRSSKGKTMVEKEGSISLVKKEYPCGCIRTTKLDINNELVGEDLLSIGCRDGSQCQVRLPRLQKHDRLLSFDEPRTESIGRFKKSRKPSSEFPEIEIVADGIVSKKPIAPKPPKPTMKGVNLTGTINLKSNKFNGVCHLYLEPRLKEYLRNNMHILQELLEKDERKSSKRSS